MSLRYGLVGFEINEEILVVPLAIYVTGLSKKGVDNKTNVLSISIRKLCLKGLGPLRVLHPI